MVLAWKDSKGLNIQAQEYKDWCCSEEKGVAKNPIGQHHSPLALVQFMRKEGSYFQPLFLFWVGLSEN